MAAITDNPPPSSTLRHDRFTTVTIPGIGDISAFSHPKIPPVPPHQQDTGTGIAMGAPSPFRFTMEKLQEEIGALRNFVAIRQAENEGLTARIKASSSIYNYTAQFTVTVWMMTRLSR
jgi:hypothetical protein